MHVGLPCDSGPDTTTLRRTEDLPLGRDGSGRQPDPWMAGFNVRSNGRSPEFATLPSLPGIVNLPLFFMLVYGLAASRCGCSVEEVYEDLCGLTPLPEVDGVCLPPSLVSAPVSSRRWRELGDGGVRGKESRQLC